MRTAPLAARAARVLAVALPFALAGAACSSPATKPGPGPGSAAGAGAGLPSSTGPLTEEQFKAMHAPPTEAPVPGKGTVIDLAGTRGVPLRCRRARGRSRRSS